MAAREISVEDLMDTPDGHDEYGRDPTLDDENEFDHGDHRVVGRCQRCGADIHEGVTGHGCSEGFRRHPDGEDIQVVEEVGA